MPLHTLIEQIQLNFTHFTLAHRNHLLHTFTPASWRKRRRTTNFVSPFDCLINVTPPVAMDGLHKSICGCVLAREEFNLLSSVSRCPYLSRAPFADIFAVCRSALRMITNFCPKFKVRRFVSVCFLCVFFHIFLFCRCNDSTVFIIAPASAPCFVHLLASHFVRSVDGRYPSLPSNLSTTGCQKQLTFIRRGEGRR